MLHVDDIATDLDLDPTEGAAKCCFAIPKAAWGLLLFLAAIFLLPSLCFLAKGVKVSI